MKFDVIRLLAVIVSLSPFDARRAAVPFIRLRLTDRVVAGDAFLSGNQPAVATHRAEICAHFAGETAASRRYNPD